MLKPRERTIHNTASWTANTSGPEEKEKYARGAEVSLSCHGRLSGKKRKVKELHCERQDSRKRHKAESGEVQVGY